MLQLLLTAAVCFCCNVRVWMLQGNGHEHDFMDDENVYIMDVYNFDIYPHDRRARRTLCCFCSAPCVVLWGSKIMPKNKKVGLFEWLRLMTYLYSCFFPSGWLYSQVMQHCVWSCSRSECKHPTQHIIGQVSQLVGVPTHWAISLQARMIQCQHRHNTCHNLTTYPLAYLYVWSHDLCGMAAWFRCDSSERNTAALHWGWRVPTHC